MLPESHERNIHLRKIRLTQACYIVSLSSSHALERELFSKNLSLICSYLLDIFNGRYL